MALVSGNKIENNGRSPRGKLTAKEFNEVVRQINANESEIEPSKKRLNLSSSSDTPYIEVKLLGPSELYQDSTTIISASCWVGFDVVEDVVWSIRRSSLSNEDDIRWNMENQVFNGTIQLSLEDLVGCRKANFIVGCLYEKDGHQHNLEESITVSRVLVQYTEMGNWETGVRYYAEDSVSGNGYYEISKVYHMGQSWRCLVSHVSDGTNVPGYDSPYWKWIGGDPELHVSFRETDQLFPKSQLSIPLTIQATYHGEDVTKHITDSDVVWSRYSTNAAGVERVASDAYWNKNNGGRGKAVTFVESDCETSYADGIGTLIFTAEVTLRDPITQQRIKARTPFGL